MISQLAFASLRRRPLRTALTALGIAIAVGSTVVFLSLGEGLRNAFDEGLSGLGPDLQVSYGSFDATSLSSVPQLPLRYLEALRRDAAAYGITEVTPVLLYLRGSLAAASAFVFYGIPLETDLRGLYRDFEIVEGRDWAERPATAGAPGSGDVPVVGEALVGEQTARRGGIAVGDVLRLNPSAAFEVVGTAVADGGLLDNAILVPLEPLQTALGAEDRLSFVMLELADTSAAAATAERLSEAYPELGFQTRGDLSSVFQRAIRISDVVRLGISTIALIVGAIAVANTMLMSVFERTREFGVVRAVGARPRFLMGLVLLEALLLAMVGAVAGIALGYLGAAAVNHVAFDLIGLDVAAVTPRLVAFAAGVAAVMGLLSGLLPAARAARVPIAVAVARE
jgi:putative ABC transport system permease protein